MRAKRGRPRLASQERLVVKVEYQIVFVLNTPNAFRPTFWCTLSKNPMATNDIRLQKANEVNDKLNQCYVELERDPGLKDLLIYNLSRKEPSGPRYLNKLAAFEGPDSETRLLLEQNEQRWTHNPATFTLSGFEVLPNRGDHPVVYVARQCLWLERQDAKATMLRRAYRVVFHRLRQSYGARLEDLVQPLADMHHFQCSTDQVIAKLDRLLESGSRLECWIEDICTGAIFYMGSSVANEVYDDPPSLREV